MPTAKYEGDDTEIYGIRLSAARLAAAGTQPSGSTSSSIKAKVSKSNREYGLRPRGVRLAREIDAGADGTFTKYTFLPVLTRTAFNGSTYAIGATVTIGGTSWKVVAKESEDY